jgi:hypothetical protein
MLVQLGGQCSQHGKDSFLLFAAFGFFGNFFCGVFLFAGGEVAKGFLLFEFFDTLWTGLEAQAQGAFDGDLAIAEVERVEYFAVFFLAEGKEQFDDLANMLRGDFAALMSCTLMRRFSSLRLVSTQIYVAMPVL